MKQSVADVFDSPPAHATYSEMARRIRVDLDKKMNGGSRGWSVVVGRSYGAYITQKIKNYAYISVFPGAFKCALFCFTSGTCPFNTFARSHSLRRECARVESMTPPHPSLF